MRERERERGEREQPGLYSELKVLYRETLHQKYFNFLFIILFFLFHFMFF